MTTIKKIDHVAIVVEDIDAALKFWRDALHLELDHVEVVPDQQSVVAFLPMGDSEVELVKPISDNSGISRFLSKRGPGIHHICFEVDNVEQVLSELQIKGVKLINEAPMIGTGGKKIAFIHPESTHGVLVELYETSQLEPFIRQQRARSVTRRVRLGGAMMAAATMAFLRALRESGDGKQTKVETTEKSIEN